MFLKAGLTKISNQESVFYMMKSGNQLKCTVWDQHVEKVMPYLRKDFAEPVIVLIQMGRVKVSENFKHFPEMFNTYCPGLLADKDDGLSQVTDYETDSDEGFFSEEEAESPNVNAVKEQSVDVTESDAVKRSLLDQFSSTQNSKKKRVMVVKEEGDDDKET
nr:replication protein A 70 kDa DNA-binding subunit A-like [Ipomoea batatas]